MSEHPNGLAPTGDKFAMGARQGETARAWQRAWDLMSRTEYLDGIELSEQATEGLNVQAVSLHTHLRLAAREGWLETDTRWVDATFVRYGKTHAGRRKRTFYRIGSRARAAA